MLQCLQPSARVAGFSQDVWSIFSPMAVYCNAVNLGQGFPNFETPEFIKQAASEAVFAGVNQYSPPKGLLRLRKALSKEYSPLFKRALGCDEEIIVTAGANEGIYSVLQAFLGDGDEVVVFEPFFDQYSPNITMSGGVLKYCPLKLRDEVTNQATVSASDWVIDFEELEHRIITSKTKIMILNTPHNPIGKVFTREELQQLADVAKRRNLLVISDEVYERLVYDGKEHLRIATLDGMWERTITVGSAGKSFCATGWRVGWLIGPKELIHYSLLAHSRIVFCTNAPLQEAVAIGLEREQELGFFKQQLQEYQQRRDYLLKVFQDLGLQCTVPDGSYFILVNIDKIKVSEEELKESEEVELKFCQNPEELKHRSRDWKICRWLTTKIGVAAIPPSEFYGQDNRKQAESFARFCFCKTDETLKAARERLMKLKEYI
ncbi:hypothetical protein MP638_001178 [Amoeboaphelidium occidentale]|nr:hypothetical protein MP638_001178 [Amoeboaphelidium occidentale]